jgi:hypothetical protein
MDSPRWLVQLSDLPWLVVAGALGLVLEGVLLLSGITPQGEGWWTLPFRGALAAGGICGWLAFRFGRGGGGMLLGGGSGLVVAVVLPWLVGLVGGAASPPDPALLLTLGIGWVILPPLTHTMVLPLLRLGPIRRLAAHHPRYRHLRTGAAGGSGPLRPEG